MQYGPPPLRGVLATLALAALTSCLSYSSGRTRRAAPPALLDTAPPRFLVEAGSDTLRSRLEGVLSATPGCGAPTRSPAESDAVLKVKGVSHYEGSTTLFAISALTAFLLPLPMEKSSRGYELELQLPGDEPVVLPRAERSITYWFGLPLIALCFVQADEREQLDACVDDLGAIALRGWDDRHDALWAAANETGELDTFETFVQAFPTSRHAPAANVALEDGLWERARASESSGPALRYLGLYPDGAHAADVRSRGDRLLWNETRAAGDTAAYESYLDWFPHGVHSAEASQRLEDMLWKRASDPGNSADRYRAYLARFPDGPHSAEARDAVAWADAEVAGTQRAVELYLLDRPDGAYAANARRALSVLNAPDREEHAREIAALVRNALRPKSTGPYGLQPTGKYSGLMTAVEGETTLVLRYTATYTSSGLGESTIHAGTVTHHGAHWRIGSDGAWYPLFERHFVEERAGDVATDV